MLTSASPSQPTCFLPPASIHQVSLLRMLDTQLCVRCAAPRCIRHMRDHAPLISRQLSVFPGYHYLFSSKPFFCICCLYYSITLAFVKVFFVFDPHQHQSMRRRRHACGFPVFRLKNTAYVFRRIKSPPDLQKRSRNDPHHIVKKSISPNPDRQVFSAFLHGQLRTVSSTSVWILQKLAKSCSPTRYPAAFRICSRSK